MRHCSLHASAVRRRDAVDDLQDPAVVDAVLGPRAGEVLDAADLDRRDRAVDPGARGGGGCGRRCRRRSPGAGASRRRGRRWRRGRCRSSRGCGWRRTRTAGGGPSRAPAPSTRRRRRRASRAARRVRWPVLALGTDGVEQGDGDAGQLDPLVAGVLVLAAVGVVVAARRRGGDRRTAGGSSASKAANSSGVPSVDRSPLTITASTPAAAISAAAAWFIVSGYGGSPGAARRIGPSVWSSMRPASTSPKWTSLTVPMRQRSGPAGAAACGTRSRRARARCPARARRGGRRSCRRGTWRRRRRRWSARRPRSAPSIRPRVGPGAAGSAGSTTAR